MNSNKVFSTLKFDMLNEIIWISTFQVTISELIVVNFVSMYVQQKT